MKIKEVDGIPVVNINSAEFRLGIASIKDDRPRCGPEERMHLYCLSSESQRSGGGLESAYNWLRYCIDTDGKKVPNEPIDYDIARQWRHP